jgi:hypothetical protein
VAVRAFTTSAIAIAPMFVVILAACGSAGWLVLESSRAGAVDRRRPATVAAP